MIKKYLQEIDSFKNLDETELDAVVAISKIITLHKDNILFYEGDFADAFYLLLKGELKLYKTGIKSNEVILHYFHKPTMVAEMATLENMNFPATAAVTQDNTLVAVLQKDAFISLLQNSSNLSLHIIQSLTKKIKNLEVAINRNLIFDATTKVCSLLYENEEIFAVQKHTQIATFLNMAPETLSRTIAKLKKLQILTDDYKIKDRQKLQMFLEF